MSEVEVLMSESEARRLTEEVKTDAAALWTKLLALYERKAHIALGYSSWADYYETEFGKSRRTGYRLLEAARAVEALGPSDTRVTQNAARELSSLNDEPKRMREA